ncbi:hypothetical protein CEE45_11040 [Candidatus Heimdallarchaeota archaeon B3_Heim]|nr:MAG: hypothetical protein CEE45_11040 [Candidatus Heimdallarchaeota archaeon B3_Heim]
MREDILFKITKEGKNKTILILVLFIIAGNSTFNKVTIIHESTYSTASLVNRICEKDTFNRNLTKPQYILTEHVQSKFEIYNQPIYNRIKRETSSDSFFRAEEYRKRHLLPISDYNGISTFSDQSSAVYSVAYGPNGTIASSSDGLILIWNATTGSILNSLSYGSAVRSISFHHNGSVLAFGTDDFKVNLWNLNTDNVKTLSNHAGAIHSVSFSPNGSLLASGSEDWTINLWYVDGTTTPIKTLIGHFDTVYAVDFSHNDTVLISGSADNDIRIWDVNTPVSSSKKLLTGFHNDSVRSVSYSPTGEYFASGAGSVDKTIKIWDGLTAALVDNLTDHTDVIRSVTFDPKNDELLASGSQDGKVNLWNITTASKIKEMTDHSGFVYSVSFDPSGNHLISGGTDTTVKLWNLNLGNLIGKIDGHTNYINSIAFSPNGSLLASGSEDTTARIWNTTTGGHLLTLPDHISPIDTLAFSPNSSTLATGSPDNNVILWDLNDNGNIVHILNHPTDVTSVVFHPNGSILASSLINSNISLWNINTGELICNLPGNTDEIHSLTFNQDGNHLVAGLRDGSINIWDVETRSILTSLTNHSDSVVSLAFSSNAQYFASGSKDSSILVWNASTFEIIYNLTGHSAEIKSVIFSPDGSALASCADDQTIQVWDMVDGSRIRTMNDPNNATSVAFNLNGNILASGNRLSTAIKLWNSSISLLSFDNFSSSLVKYNSDLNFKKEPQCELSAGWNTTSLTIVHNSSSFRTPSSFDPYRLFIKTKFLGREIARDYNLFIISTFTDYDGDGLPNSWEKIHSTDLLVNDASDDIDNDYLSNLGEFQAQTDPNNRDSDNDGWFDGSEVSNSSNPLVNNSAPFITWPESLKTLNNSATNISNQSWQVNTTNAKSIDIWVNDNYTETVIYPFIWNVTLIEELNNLTYIAYYDVPVNYNKTVFLITLDSTAPTINLVNPLTEDAVLNSKSTITINVQGYNELFSYWDNGSFSKTEIQTKVNFISNHTSLKLLNTKTDSNINFELPGSDGVHTLYLMAVDEVGNIRLADFSFITDDTPPTAIIQGISEFLFMSGTKVIRVIPSDNNSIDRVEFELSGDLITTDNNSPYRWEWNTAETEDGIYLIRITVYDAAGNAYTKTFYGIFVVNDPIEFLCFLFLEYFPVFLLIILAILILIIICSMRKKIHILYTYANPPINPLEIKPEIVFNKIEEELKETKYGNRIKLIQKGEITKDDLSPWLADPNFKLSVFQFSGHGKKGYLQFINPEDTNLGEAIPADHITEAFRLHKNKIKIVVLRACSSLKIAESLMEHIDIIIGMSKEVQDAAAAKFTIGFYKFLAAGKNVQEAYEKGLSDMEISKGHGRDIVKLVHREEVKPGKVKLFRWRFLLCFL